MPHSNVNSLCPERYFTLGLINQDADDEVRSDYPLLVALQHRLTGALLAVDPAAAVVNDPAPSPARLEPHLPIERDTAWHHVNGNDYYCLGLANEGLPGDQHPVLVLYRDFRTGQFWGKAPERFLNGMQRV
ncbi:hypothetical protein V0M98_38475 (plasmid) [Pseudomonas silesiensis]|uniref:hypothetical protein n=1 Tax=Pseudomonas silesiensis TaxID=1853130 RepID=UPI0030D4CB65